MFLHIAVGLGEDHHIPLVADTFEIFQRNRIRHAPVEHLHPFELYYLRRQRHRGGGTDPVVSQRPAFVELLIDGLARFHICADGIECHRVLLKGLVVEDVVLGWDDVVAKLRIIEVARLPP